MKKTSSVYVLSFMVAICVVFGAGVSAVHYSTRNLMQKNEKLHKNRIVCNAFMLEIKDKTASAYQKTIDDFIISGTIKSGSKEIEYFTNKTNNNIGFVFKGLGFWDVISGIIVLTDDFSIIQNIQFLEQKETPGLGARIEEQWFTEQFKELQIDWDAPVNERIIIGKLSSSNKNNRVDAITGASQTSIALMNILNNELDYFKSEFGKKL